MRLNAELTQAASSIESRNAANAHGESGGRIPHGAGKSAETSSSGTQRNATRLNRSANDRANHMPYSDTERHSS